MNILISVNSAYYEAARIMLKSLVVNNKEQMDVYLFYSDLKDRHINGFRRIVEHKKNQLHVIKIDESIMKGVPITRLAKETYYRLMAPSLLPVNLDRILYLDIDMIIKGDLRPCYHVDFNNNLFMAVPDTSNGIDVQKRKLHMGKYAYINAGVLLMNLELLRTEFSLEEALDFARKYPDRIPSCDQDIINALYHKRIGMLKSEYNYEARFHSIAEILRYPYIYNIMKRKVKIIHYMGPDKPWEKGFCGKFLWEYYRYARHTPIKKRVWNNILMWPVYIMSLMWKILSSKWKLL